MHNVEAFKRMQNARSVLLIDHPFYGCLLLQLRLRENPFIETMATDGIHLDYNPDYVMQADEQELICIIVHEGLHVAWRHHTRIGGRHLEDFNRAADYAINPDLVKFGFKFPSWGLLEMRFAGMSVEDIYDIIHPEQEQKRQQQQQQGQQGQQPQQGGQSGGQQQQQQSKGNDKGQGKGKGDGKPEKGNGKPEQGSGQPGQGQGEPMPGHAPDPGRMGGIIPPAAPHEQHKLAAEDARWEEIVRQAITVAVSSNAGKVPGYLQRLVGDLAKSRVSWKTIFRNFVDESKIRKSSWTTPNKRFAWMGITLPGRVPDGLRKLVAMCDTSGSVNDKLTNQYAGEITAILDDHLVDTVVVIYTDTRVTHVQEFQRGDDVVLDPKGGGGTNFKDAFDYVAEHHNDASAVVFFTDLIATDYGEDPGIPVLWTVYGAEATYHRYKDKVPFGETMYIEFH